MQRVNVRGRAFVAPSHNFMRTNGEVRTAMPPARASERDESAACGGEAHPTCRVRGSWLVCEAAVGGCDLSFGRRKDSCALVET